MKRIRSIVHPILAGLAVGVAVAATFASSRAVAQAPVPRRIAVFGSSVATGTGDELRKEGYTGRLRELLAPLGWEVVNVSRGGDNTRTMANRFAPSPDSVPNPAIRYLLTATPAYVVLGLSLGNEGIANVRTVAAKDSVFAQFARGMQSFIARSRAAGIVPIVSLCYTRNDFTAVEYEYTRRMNLLINSWDVPSVNFLGAVDDGTGKWANGFWNDALHPTAEGHAELATTFVPSLFEALERGKPIPVRPSATGFAHIGVGEISPLSFSPTSPMHPFAVSVTLRAQGDGTVFTVFGHTLDTSVVLPSPGRGGAASARIVTSLRPGYAFRTSLQRMNGRWSYTTLGDEQIPLTARADTGWHTFVLSHYAARGETVIYVDGQPAGRAKERLSPSQIHVGGPGASHNGPAFTEADLRDVLIYRSALNGDEVAALQRGTLLQASLEVYAPLTDATFTRAGAVENRAQSMALLRANAGSLAHVPR